MDALSPMHPAQRVVVMKGAQIGATEAGNNWIGYVIHHAPGPMLAVQPTVELAKRFSQQLWGSETSFHFLSIDCTVSPGDPSPSS